MSAKRSFVDFVNLVKSSLARINKTMCRNFSSKARSYMLGYIHAMKEDELRNEWVEKEDSIIEVKLESSHEKNEKIHKIYRSHRDANCTDWKFNRRGD